MILIEHLPGILQVQVVDGQLAPGERNHPVQVGPDHTVLGGRGWEFGESIQFPAGHLVCLGRKSGLLEFGAEFFDLGRLFVHFAQFALNRLQLLAQEVLALYLLDLFSGLFLDLLPEREHFDFSAQ